MSDNHDMNEIYLRESEIDGLRKLIRAQEDYVADLSKELPPEFYLSVQELAGLEQELLRLEGELRDLLALQDDEE